MDKVRLGKGEVKGGLVKEDVWQFYVVNFMPQTEEFSPKLELVIGLEGEGLEGKQWYRSMRFGQPMQVRTFLMKVMEGYAFFLKKVGAANEENWHYLFEKALEEMKEGFIRGMKE